jgi:hypothetical protein
MQSKSTATWLKAASAIVFGFGVLTALAALPALAGPTRILADIMFWPLDGAQSLAAPEARILCAIGGGVMAGWGALLWLVAAKLYPRDPELARTMTLASVGIWFAIDSFASILAGAPVNAVLNIGFLLLFVLPLRRGRAIAAA